MGNLLKCVVGLIVFVGADAYAMQCFDLFSAPQSSAAAAARFFSDVNHVRFEMSVASKSLVAAVPAQVAARLRSEASRKVGEAVRRYPAGKTVRTVFYPASGYDAATPFQVFKDAHTVVAVDEHPFIQDTLPSLTASSDASIAYVNWTTVGKVSSVAEFALGRLRDEISNFRLRSVVAFRSKEPEYIRTYDVAFRVMVAAVTRHRWHGIIEFDTGPGTIIKRYIHIDDVLSPEKHWWFSKLADVGFQGLLAKGSMNALGNWTFKEGSTSESVVHHLLRNGGVIVDTDAIDWPWPGLLQEEEADANASRYRHLDFSGVRTELAGVPGFGYAMPWITWIVPKP